MEQVKIFGNSDEKRLEEAINHWLRTMGNDIEITERIFTSTPYSHAHGSGHWQVMMIFYKIKSQ